jgi:hypothetical protein
MWADKRPLRRVTGLKITVMHNASRDADLIKNTKETRDETL